MRFVLASASPRRAELLRQAGFSFEIIAAEVDEQLRAHESARDYVRRLAQEKSAAVLTRLSSPAIVLGADTAVVVDGDILGKPRGDTEASGMLRRLSGRWHDVITGISLRAGNHEVGRVETTRVEFRPLSEADIRAYVASGEGRNKAGAYAIQGVASRFIPRIEGSYANVVGLPVATVAQLLGDIESRLASHTKSSYPDSKYSRKPL